jgi:hypothetical protein
MTMRRFALADHQELVEQSHLTRENTFRTRLIQSDGGLGIPPGVHVSPSEIVRQLSKVTVDLVHHRRQHDGMKLKGSKSFLLNMYIR